LDFRFTEDEEAFRKEVRDFIEKELPLDWPGEDPELPHEDALDEVYQLGKEIRRKLAAKGWLGLSWPKEYGGQGATATKELILQVELVYRGVPGVDYYGLALVGPSILQSGTEEQKRRFLIPITRGEVKWSVGMSEPNAGSDLFSLQLSAVEEEECFVLNGQKTWQSGAHRADWCIVYARTDPDAPKAKGISVLLVDLRSPGITMRRLTHITGLAAFNEVFYDNVRVPKENLLGEKNGGSSVAFAALATERGYGIGLLYNAKRDFEQLVQYCKENYIDGQPLAKDPLIRSRLAELAIEIEVGCNLRHRLHWMVSKGMFFVHEAQQLKVYGANVAHHLANLGMQILGLYGQLEEKSKWAKLRGRMRHVYLHQVVASIGGGTSEIAKNVSARIGLGLPRG